MNTNLIRILLCGLLCVSLLSACTNRENAIMDVLIRENEAMQRDTEEMTQEMMFLRDQLIELDREYSFLLTTFENYETEYIAVGLIESYAPLECENNCLEIVLPEMWAEASGSNIFKQTQISQQNVNMRGQIRVFQNGNANVKLFPDETFIANLFHNQKITGTYTEMTSGDETAVLFTYNGENNISRGVSSFDVTGQLTVVGGIKDSILTIPEDWDDGHNHGMDFAFVAYPLVFSGENNQKITLYADNTFEADFADGIKIIGYYGIRATSVTFVAGSPTFDRNGVPVGTFLFAELKTCWDETTVVTSEQGNDDDCDIEDEVPTPTETPQDASVEAPTPTEAPQETPVEPPTETTEETLTDALPAGHEYVDGLEWCEECQEWH